jgi:hypothetical protein
LGVRINGSMECVLAEGVTMPEPNGSKTWSKNIGDLM